MISVGSQKDGTNVFNIVNVSKNMAVTKLKGTAPDDEEMENMLLN